MFVYEIWTYDYEDDIFDVATICCNRKDALHVHRDVNHHQRAKYFIKPIIYGQCHAAKFGSKIFGVDILEDFLQRRICNKWMPEFAPEELPF